MPGELNSFIERVESGMSDAVEGALIFDTERRRAKKIGDEVSRQLTVINEFDPSAITNQLNLIYTGIETGRLRMTTGIENLYDALGGSNNQHALAAQELASQARDAISGTTESGATAMELTYQLGAVLCRGIPEALSALKGQLDAALAIAALLASTDTTEVAPSVLINTTQAASEISQYGTDLGVGFDLPPTGFDD
ncbi:MAG TPA: hypothetical protein VMR45_05160 [Patescibacteria group bacterium]|nr:hypothetical protein [Patescibacteria group bacterium]